MDISSLQRIQIQNVQKLLSNHRAKDVTFVIGAEKDEYLVHRLMMASISPVWEASLYGNMKESQPNAVIELEDLDSNAFQSVVHFAYGLDPNITEANLIHVMHICSLYQISTLDDACAEFLRKLLDSRNFFSLLDQFSQLRLKKAMNVCTNTLQKFHANDIREMVNCEKFLDLSFCALKHLLKCDHLKIKEETLYERVKAWMDHKGNHKDCLELKESKQYTKKEYFQELKRFIRFPLMDSQYFVEHAMSDGLLSKEEQLSILATCACPKRKGKFPTKSRGFREIFDVWRGDLQHVYRRDMTCINIWNLDFRADSKIELVGITVCNFDQSVQLKVDVMRRKRYCGGKQSHFTRRGKKTSRIHFTRNVEIEKGTQYTVNVALQSMNATSHWRVTDVKENAMVQGVQFTFAKKCDIVACLHFMKQL